MVPRAFRETLAELIEQVGVRVEACLCLGADHNLPHLFWRAGSA